MARRKGDWRWETAVENREYRRTKEFIFPFSLTLRDDDGETLFTGTRDSAGFEFDRETYKKVTVNHYLTDERLSERLAAMDIHGTKGCRK